MTHSERLSYLIEKWGYEFGGNYIYKSEGTMGLRLTGSEDWKFIERVDLQCSGCIKVKFKNDDKLYDFDKFNEDDQSMIITCF